jgi:hypothetical protein
LRSIHISLQLHIEIVLAKFAHPYIFQTLSQPLDSKNDNIRHPRFAAEFVFNPSKLFNEGGGTAEGGGVRARIVHVEMEIYLSHVGI